MSRPIETPAQRALSAATVALAAALIGLALFLPPLLDRTTASVLRTVATACGLAVALVLHWVFVAIAARRMERSVAGWTALSVLLFPIGSATALVLLSWFSNDNAGVGQRPLTQHG